MKKDKKHLPTFAIVFRGLVILLIWAVGVGVFTLLVRSKEEVDVSNTAREAQRVLVFDAKQVPIRRQFTGYGTAQPIDSADVPVRVRAVVQSIPEDVEVGQPVTAGQLLVQLDPVDYERQAAIADARIEELEAQKRILEVERERLQERAEIENEDIEIAQNELEREERLNREIDSSQKLLDAARRSLLAAKRNLNMTNQSIDRIAPQIAQIEAQIEAQRTSLKIANEDIARTRITSPIDGVLQLVDVELGEEVQPGTPVARVVSLKEIEIPLRLPASARSDIGVGDPVSITATDGSRTICDSTIARIEPEDDLATRTMTVYVEISQTGVAKDFAAGGELLAPGRFVRGVVTSHIEQDHWIVPRRAIRDERVFFVQDGVVRSRPTKSIFSLEQTFTPQFGLPDDQWVALRDKDNRFQPGEQIVVNAAASLLDGARVTPVNVRESLSANGGSPSAEVSP